MIYDYKGEREMKVELALLVGAESKQWLADLALLADRLESLIERTSGKKEDAAPKATKSTPAPAATKSNGKKAAAPVVDDEEENFDLDGEEAEETEEADEDPITVKDVIAACKENREKAIKVLKKMKVKSVHELKPELYKKVLAEIGA